MTETTQISPEALENAKTHLKMPSFIPESQRHLWDDYLKTITVEEQDDGTILITHNGMEETQ